MSTLKKHLLCPKCKLHTLLKVEGEFHKYVRIVIKILFKIKYTIDACYNCGYLSVNFFEENEK